MIQMMVFIKTYGRRMFYEKTIKMSHENDVWGIDNGSDI